CSCLTLFATHVEFTQTGNPETGLLRAQHRAGPGAGNFQSAVVPVKEACESGLRRAICLASSVIRIPCFGRRVKLGTGVTGCSGTARNRKRCAIVASSSVASIMANEAPMHCLGPPPKGK